MNRAFATPFRNARAGGRRPLDDRMGLLISLMLGFAYGAFFVLRFNGHWAEIDSSVFTLAIGNLQEYGSIFHPGRYDHGYGYSVWGATLASLTGLGVPTMSRWLVPIVGCLLLSVAGFVTFRTWMPDVRGALAAVAVLFLTPEVVFTFARNNHEKLTVTLVLVAAFLMTRSFLLLQERKYAAFAPLAVSYHLVVFLILSMNTIFGATFVGATTVVLTAASVLSRHPGWRERLAPVVPRLGIMIAVSWLMIFLVSWDVYAQVEGKTEILSRTVAGITALFEERTVASNPYAEMSTTGGIWASPAVQQAVSVFRPVLMAGSFATLLALLVAALRRPALTPLPRLFMLGFYGAYGMILALSVPVDLVGVYGSNLSVRMFSYFAVFAAPLLAVGFLAVYGRIERHLPKRPARALLGTLVGGMLVASLVKSTLDPVASRFWMIYTPSEAQALWTWNHLQSASWLYGTSRLRSGYVVSFAGQPSRGNAIEGDPSEAFISFAIESDLFATEAVLHDRPAVPFARSEAVYDNGGARLLHRIPTTPFQR